MAGSWFLFVKEENRDSMLGVTDRVDVGPYFWESNSIVVGVVVLVAVLWGLLLFINFCR